MRKQSRYKIGETIQNRWEIYDILYGGMGLVYVVYDQQWHEAYAVKTFQDEVFASNPSIADRFMQEELAWINLDAHQNVTRAHFVHKIEGKAYLFLEYVSGGDLSGWVGTPRLTEDLPRALRFAIQFCDGMIHALSKGIKAHRDIKPANCLITQDGTLKITDFGLAKVFDEARSGNWSAEGVSSAGASLASTPPQTPALMIGLTQAGSSAGTCTHMAPEQFEDVAKVDWRADIYSFGVLLFEMVTGRLPFVAQVYTQGDAWEKYRQAHQTQMPPQLKSGHPGLDALVARCLSKQPEQRGGGFVQARAELAELYLRLTGEVAPQPLGSDELTAEDLNNKGMSLHTLGQSDAAVSWFERALEINPSLAVAWMNKGNMRSAGGDFAAALSCFERALEINPQLAEAWMNKGVLLHKWAQFEPALSCFERALEINPRYDNAWFNKGNVLAAKGDFSAALSCFERALEINLRFALAWSHKGNSLKELDQIEAALTCYERAIEFDPRYDGAWFNMGSLLADMGQVDAALSSFERVLEINPRSVEAWSSKGVLLDNEGDFSAALSCYKRALEIDPRHENAWFNMGALLKGLGQVEAALSCFERALEINPRIADAWLSKGNLLSNKGESTEALLCYERVLEINPRLADAWFNKGALLANSGQHQKALACFERAYELGLHRAVTAIAFCRQMLGQK